MKAVINILLADDDLDDHEFFKEAIQRIDNAICNVAYVYNGLQAIDYLLRRNTYAHVKDPMPDIVVLDLNMPILDGFEALRQIRKNEIWKSIPVYVLSTSRERLHIRKCEDLGCAGFFSKPPKTEELIGVIRKMIDGASA